MLVNTFSSIILQALNEGITDMATIDGTIAQHNHNAWFGKVKLDLIVYIQNYCYVYVHVFHILFFC